MRSRNIAWIIWHDKLLSRFSTILPDSADTRQVLIGIILNAKHRVEKDHQDIGVIIPLDDEELKPLMTKALRRYFNALRSNEKHIKNVENYLYGTMQNLFGVWWNKQAAREYAAKHPEEQNTDNGRSWN
ncbi:plasmid replication initiator protein A [Lacticaseibacillus paracasei]|uniref:plasmid replication initiator protein A n=1 Tax=Lacticaseibacillus paracasei TaxID=1597 RepID=UPI00194E6C74|nr:plasmid replication initiator protein A [Lacticaseibacillus paracasei]MBM6411600.1 plasmid replication initiator protein A [Lacticaseibacillus paracasei]